MRGHDIVWLCMLRHETEFLESSKTLLAKNIRTLVINTTIVQPIFFWSLQRPMRSGVGKISKERLLALLFCPLVQEPEQFGRKGIRRIKVRAKLGRIDLLITFCVEDPGACQYSRQFVVSQELRFPSVMIRGTLQGIQSPARSTRKDIILEARYMIGQILAVTDNDRGSIPDATCLTSE